ncbi:MAG: UDP-N-acetylmuramoyl-L-alanyl-D-glutamate--2,6-diaminopimelate ligase [bacterium]|nr:UDP-N-acetylmuramoyl-L-alanyl-D-glutamate--2,6-diaminopimelate ligase [bacterium]
MKRFIPKKLLNLYHLLWAYGGALWYGFPSKKLFVIAVTGTKGKSTVAELIRAILAEAGYTVALASTIRFCIGQESTPNLFKMTMPGRAYLQQFLRKAVTAGCTHAVVEMTSEGAVQFRHKGIALDALVFTNLQPEHLESHGGIEHYAAVKLSLAKHLKKSSKRPRYIVANIDDAYGAKFLEAAVEVCVPFSLSDAEPYTADDRSVRFVYKREELFTAPLPGLFNLKNILAAMALCDGIGIPHEKIKRALEHIEPIAGRAEYVERGQNFSVVVDYAHTPDSLRALYETFASPQRTVLGEPRLKDGPLRQIICVLGNTGGGRDTWKRPLMGAIAEEHCSQVILTNEDPYDENPRAILDAMRSGMKREPTVILDRREAIAHALALAQTLRQAQGDQNIAVLITGKGTDPYIMGPRGSKQPWSDKVVAEEELDKLLHKKVPSAVV